jgi:uncharacterized membrane protein
MIKQFHLRMHSALGRYSLAAIVSMHLVGVVGMLSPYQDYFKLLTPVNLLLSGFWLWINHRELNAAFNKFVLFTIAFGFLVELVGVNTGFLFGDYTYGQTLGPKLLNVPIIIGLNWLLVIYSIAALTDSLKAKVVLKVLLGSLLAVFIDWMIEPVAMKYDFWTWTNGYVPFQNYLGWFLTSSVMLTAYHTLKVNAENRLALPYYFIQLFFFLIIGVVVAADLANF